MSLYILPENQKVIWDSMNIVPLFQQFDQHSSGHREETGHREEWFREIIHQFYENNKFKLLSVQELQQLNRETITYMIQNLKEMVAANAQPAPASSVFSGHQPLFGESLLQNNMSASSNQVNIKFPSTSIERKSVTRDFILEQKQEELNKQFSNRQKDYGEMLKRGPQQEIDFRSVNKDEPIDNMDALIKQHMAQRDAEIQSYAAPSLSSVSDYTSNLDVIDLGKSQNFYTNSENTYENTSRLSNYNAPKEIVRSSKFPYADITDEPPPKNVRWSENLEVTNGGSHRPSLPSRKNGSMSEMGMFQEFMTDMKDYMQSMRDEIELLKREKYGGMVQSPMMQQQNHNQPNHNQPNHNPLVSNILSRLRKTPDNVLRPEFAPQQPKQIIRRIQFVDHNTDNIEDITNTIV